MRLRGSSDARRHVQNLRRQITPPEIALWLALRGNEAGLRFRRQHAAGPYMLDFYCAPARLAIEVDGEVHNRGNRPERDASRDDWLVAQGIRILRYPAGEMVANLDDVARQIVTIATGRRDVFE